MADMHGRFWGEMISRASAGPAPIPHKTLTVENLSEALKFAMSPSAKVAAGKMGEKIRAESGEQKGVDSFHRHLPIKNMW
jgi:sterol 3beta-glucosyltransferase